MLDFALLKENNKENENEGGSYFSLNKFWGLKRTRASLARGLWRGCVFLFTTGAPPLYGTTNFPATGFRAAAKRTLT